MTDVVDGIVTGHVLLLQEISGMAFALSEDCDQNVRPCYLLASGGLHMNDRTLDHALKSGRWFGILGAICNQIFELRLKISGQAAP